MSNASWVAQVDAIFNKWLAEVEQEFPYGVDHDQAFAAWQDGYSIAEYVIQLEDNYEPPDPWAHVDFPFAENH
jgi:hypothetical protein